jgi:hypothetical protein
MDINEAGKPQWRELLPLFLTALLGVVVAALGGAFVVGSWPANEYEASGWRWLGVGTGLTLLWAGGSWFWAMRATLIRGVVRYQDRVDEWHWAMLEKYQDGDGRVIAQQVSEWAYNPLDLRSVLLAYAVVLVERPAALTIDSLQRDGLWIQTGHRMAKMMTFSQDSAALFLDLLAEARVIEGRGPRRAGRVLVEQPRDQLARLITLAARDPKVQAAMAASEGV